ncbi:MAG: 30S ribosomal protein S12 methylthiotransferase RimO [Candidatus Krumholzibacteria bacterium]|nr:30S ribosomal protein S12 methylthiotransferase RimO [Candidatus Krumholzibacteria bacterium]MDH4337976.1 30S ribosomal protein S12 methylthiotransferase RimO [Candidatus Krumholzibacteria bacterium]MDH5268895.1 30S ribosomal protein S12 methylthiotransferase RimO [Candidatus Krumholzibacteria bacterium]
MKAYIVTLGCPKNLVDSEATHHVLRGSGCEITADPRAADVLMVGACSFLDASWQETVEETRRLARYKRGARRPRLILMGCLPRHRQEDLESTLPWVDHFLPTGAHGRLPELFASWQTDAPLARTIALGDADRFAGMEGRELLTPAHTAYVKVAEGCNRSCTFCAIPIIRGRQVSRSADAIVREVDGLVARGVREVTLLAQDIVSYRDGATRFADVVDRLTGTGVEWIRIFYLHPAGVTVDHIARLFEHPSVCRYLEMPVQHASSRVLELMKRSYDRPHVEKLIGDIRAAFPDAVIRSEVIAGFPGETETEFEELKNFLSDFEFDSLGVFPYSPEPGTEAAPLAAADTAAVASERAAELSAVQEAASFGARARFRDKTLRVLVDRTVEPDETEYDACTRAGRFYGQALDIDGEVYLDGDTPPGEFVEVRIQDTDVFDLRGEALPASIS